MMIVYIAIAMALIIMAWNLPSVVEIVSSELGKIITYPADSAIREGAGLLSPIAWAIAISIAIFTISIIVIYYKKSKQNKIGE